MSIAKVVRGVLADRGMSQTDLAKITGWGTRKVSRICLGQQQAREEEIRELCRVLGLGPSELFAESDR